MPIYSPFRPPNAPVELLHAVVNARTLFSGTIELFLPCWSSIAATQA